MPRLTDPNLLHPILREKALKMAGQLAIEGIPLQLYEGARSPFRQAELYARGRVLGIGEMGKTSTRAHAWDSFHQYGMGVDFVFFINGQPRWDEPKPGMWARYQEIAKGMGLRPLSFEIPHVELPLSLNDLHAGRFPPGGDTSWRHWLEEQAELWGSAARTVSGIVHPGAPRALLTVDERPAAA